jgi:hypothetical protein
LRTLFLLCGIVLLFIYGAKAQGPALPGSPVTLQNAPQRDTTNRSAKKGWRDDPVSIHATKAFSALKFYPDTSLHTFHRRPFLQPFKRDLGNLGTPVRNQLFTPENLGTTGPSLGYHVYDAYYPRIDSILYYNTTRPYTDFNYQLGSKLEQTLRIMHTQNITPGWNAAVSYQKINSAGFYRLQRSNHDAGTASTHYQSRNQQYELFGAMTYSKFQTDENGGINGDTLLTDSIYTERLTIPVLLENENYTSTSSQGRRSSVTNTFRDFSMQIRHQYTLGRRDTFYNADSTEYSVRLVPRFAIQHRLLAGSQKRIFKNLAPDSFVYAPFFNRSFGTVDSVYSAQQWSWVDNNVSLNGFFGPADNQLAFQAGIGNRLDNFYTDVLNSRDRTSIISNYLSGSLRKEALRDGDWGYSADAKFFFSGTAVGNFLLNGELSKDFGRKIGSIRVGAMQQLSDAPYAYTMYANQYYRQTADLGKQSTTMLWAEVANEPRGIRLGIRNYLIGNYIYLKDSLEGVSNGKLQMSQYDGAVNVTQLYLRYLLRLGHLVVDNDMAFQQLAGGGPISIPALLGRHTIAYESYLFKNALKVATGAEVRYHSAYNAEGYNPFYNRFYYQSSYTSINKPELAAFFNFKVKRFRAYIMADQVQALFWRNTVIHPNYPSQNVMFRFGFDWIMVN